MKAPDNNKEQLKTAREESYQLARLETEQKKTENLLERYIKDFSILDRTVRTMSRSINLDTLKKTAIDTILEAGNLEFSILYLFDEDASEPELSSYTGCTSKSKEAPGRIPLAEKMSAKAIETRRMVTSQDVLRDSPAVDYQGQSPESEGIGTLVSIPLKSRDRIIGTITAGAQNKIEFSAEDNRLLETLGCQIGAAIDHAQLLEKMGQLSMIDELTGLYNRRYLEGALETEIHRSQRYGRLFSLVMMDIDGFKDYNDKFGHQSGDLVLQELASVLKSGLRKMDIACRYGGDEFSIILPVTDAQKSQKLVDRIRSMFLEMPDVQSVITQSLLGLSAGIAQFPQAAVTAQSLIFLADSALYYAKQSSRNKSVLVSNLVKGAVSETSREAQQVYSLVKIAEAKEPFTLGHAKNVSIISDFLGKAMGLSFEELLELRTAALLHDVGKARIPDSVLSKPAKLTREEMEIVKGHSLEGARLVGRVAEFRKLVPAVKHHHERYDGTGYPSGLSGNDIPLHSRIISIADAYDTMVHHRVYSEIMSSKEALDEITKCSGAQFDPGLVSALLGISGSLN
jgi:diguanylate cyclase (GGDEF)-like protein/putative nucleotidyltransferase with HDIG domain